MADTILVTSNFITALGSNITRYYSVGTGSLQTNSTEANIERTWRNVGTLKNLLVNISENSILVLDTTFTLRKNLAGTSQTVSVPAGSTGNFEDTSNNVTTAATDEFDYAVVVPVTASGTISFRVISNTYTADSNTYTNFVTSNYSTADTSVTFADNTTRYASFQGLFANESTEANAYTTFKTGGTLKNAFVYITANDVGSASTIRTRKNGTTNGNIAISVTASTTGIFEDSSNTDTVSSDDEWNWQIVVPAVSGNHNIQIRHLALGFETTNSEFPLHSTRTASEAMTFNLTNYTGVGGMQFTTVDTPVRCKARTSFTAKNMVAAVTANTIATSATTFNFRVDGTTQITVSVAAGATGIFEETSDTQAVASTESFNFSIVTPNTSGSISVKQISVIASAVATYTKTFTIDTVLKENLTKTFTIDTVLKKNLTKTFTIDTVLNRNFTKTFTVDTTLLRNYTKTFTIDAVFKKNLTKTFTIDTVLLKNYLKTFTIDAVLATRGTKTFTIDAVLNRVFTKGFTIDTVLKRNYTKTFTVDTTLLRNFTKTFTIDAVFKKNLTKTFTIDTTLLRNLTKTFTIDSVLKRAFIKTFTIDTTLKRVFTKTFTIDTVLISGATPTKSFTIDAVLQRLSTRRIGSDIKRRRVRLPPHIPEIIPIELHLPLESSVTIPLRERLPLRSFVYQKLRVKLGLESAIFIKIIENLALRSTVSEETNTHAILESLITNGITSTSLLIESDVNRDKMDKIRSKLIDLIGEEYENS